MNKARIEGIALSKLQACLEFNSCFFCAIITHKQFLGREVKYANIYRVFCKRN